MNHIKASIRNVKLVSTGSRMIVGHLSLTHDSVDPNCVVDLRGLCSCYEHDITLEKVSIFARVTSPRL